MEDRIFLQSRTGDMAQFCGARRSVLAEGRAAGVETVDVWNYAGLAFSVYPGRGMDIGRLTYRGGSGILFGEAGGGVSRVLRKQRHELA